MSDLPILMSAPMVRAILREIDQPGTGKTQTRRVINPQPVGPLKGGEHLQGVPGMFRVGDTIWPINFYTSVVSNKPGPHPEWVKEHVKIAIGDRLYVREAWRVTKALDDVAPRDIDRTTMPEWLATDPNLYAGRKRPGMHLPRWASRITLIVTDVRVQRLQEISWEDAEAEGVWHASQEYREQVCIWRYAPSRLRQLRIEHFAKLWNSLNADRGYGWDANSWIAAYTFRPILGNIDQVRS